ncbi:SagB family peptide dehydrogenase [Streptomyces sp. NPDC057743]|uniref:SagB family peptide dehydrogenase n=1 Tax=Streptomyces sp. NPDC057743 TaxID=3346236 RepID=UPI0036A2E6A6
MTETAAVGDATHRYLQALRDRRSRPVDWSAAPPTYKRYPPEGRIVLPWQSSEPLSRLPRDLLGLTRAYWGHPTDQAGQPTVGPPEVRLGRPAPSGGALYPIEAYLATAGPTAGLYHYDAAHHCLDRVRPGDHRAALTRLLAQRPARLPELLLVLSAVFWRNGFKYGDFAYRLHCQETGVLTAQALALAEALDRALTVHLRFAQQKTEGLLGLDGVGEGALAILSLAPHSRHDTPSELPSYTDLLARPAAQAVPQPTPAGKLLPHLTALHQAAGKPTGRPATVRLPARPTQARHPPVPLPRPQPRQLSEGMAHRASPPNGFLPAHTHLAALATVLAAATAGYLGDLPGTHRTPVTVTPYLLVRRVAGIPPGAYWYDAGTHALFRTGDADAPGLVARGPLQPNTRPALAECAAVLIPAGDPLAGIDAFGDRWYRVQQVEAGLLLHRATLAATALGLTARIHSDGTNDTTDAALGLAGTRQRSLSFLALGKPRPGCLRDADPATP